MFSCKFAAYFQNIFSYEHLWTAAFVNLTDIFGFIYEKAAKMKCSMACGCIFFNEGMSPETAKCW